LTWQLLTLQLLQTGNVFAKDVELEVDNGANADVLEIGVLPSGAPGFFRVRSTQTLHDSINKGFICMSGRIVVPLRHLIIEV